MIKIQPATTCLFKERKDTCMYCGEKLDATKWRYEFRQVLTYIKNTCPKGHVNIISTRRRKLDTDFVLTDILMMEYPQPR